MTLDLLPRPPKPGLYTALGDRDLISWSLRALAVTFAPEHAILWVDAANQFNAHWVAQSARAFHKDSKAVLRSFKYARPFTAFQLEAMVNLKLAPAMKQHRALFAVIADPLTLYAKADDQRYATRHSFDLFANGLKTLSQHLAILLLIPARADTGYGQRLIQLSNHVIRPRLALSGAS